MNKKFLAQKNYGGQFVSYTFRTKLKDALIN